MAADAAAMSSWSRALSASFSVSFRMKALPVSFRQLLEAEPDQARRIRALPGAARGRGDGGGGLRPAIAEIDQRRDGVGNRCRRALLLYRAGETHHGRIKAGIGRRLVLQLGDDALGYLR